MNERDLFDESELRRALRLERDERVPRVDFAGLAPARAARADVAAWLLGGASLAVGGLVLAALVGGAAEGAAALVPVLVPVLAASLFDGAVGLAVPLADGIGVLALFVSPFTLLATALAALLYVRLSERGVDHVHAS